MGSVHLRSKWIFIGAKLSDKKRDQEIKGVLAHELCHYVMQLVYQNKFLPYYKFNLDIRDRFDEIVQIINKLFSDESKNPNDECNGIISSVFTSYNPDKFHLELIVRVVQILTAFDDEKTKLEYLMAKYDILFEFWKNYVIPDINKFNLKVRKDVELLNKYIGHLPNILEEEIELETLKDVTELINNKLIIVSTNAPKLLLINIQKYLKDQTGSLYDSQNIFTEPVKLNNLKIWDDFNKICSQNIPLNIFVDCTNAIPNYLGNIFVNEKVNFIFIVANESQLKELSKIVNEKKKKILKNIEINYSWTDLREESQKSLLNTKISFQNNSNIPIIDLLKDKENLMIPSTSSKKHFDSYSRIIDSQLLKLLLEKSKIEICQIPKNKQDDENFEMLFQQRQFNQESWWHAPDMTQDKLLEKVKNQKYVIISDIAGNGKSWIMKNLTNVLCEQNPNNWVSYVDLKKEIKKFKAYKDELDFSKFYVEQILKSFTDFEKEIFKNLYKNGKVFILLDGFDEIAPDYAQFVLKLAKSFESNGGNQMWISTRDYFEIDLQKMLHLDDSYRLDKFIDEKGINMIVANWILKDSKPGQFTSRDDFEAKMKSSSNYKSYQQKARRIVKKVAMNEYRSIGQPQIFKMIADIFEDDDESSLDLKGLKIFAKFAKNLYERWSYDKGLIRRTACTESQQYKLNFWKFHQYAALKGLFPKVAKLLFPNYSGKEWPVEEIIACGMMSKKDGEIFFLHETFREYFVADFIAKALDDFNSEGEEKIILELFVKILTDREFKVIRVFLNDAIEKTTLMRIQPKIQENSEQFLKTENFGDFFTKDLKNLIDFIIGLLYSSNRQNLENNNCIKKLLMESDPYADEIFEDSEIFLKYQDFLFDFLQKDELKHLIVNYAVFQRIILAGFKIEIFETFISKTAEKTDFEFIQDQLKFLNNRAILCCSSSLNENKIKSYLKILQIYFKSDEIFDMIKNCNQYNKSILSVCFGTENKENFKNLWIEVEDFYGRQNSHQEFKDLVLTADKDGLTIMQKAAECLNLDFNEVFWKLVLNTFKNREELKNILINNEIWEFNIIHLMHQNSENDKILQFTLQIFKNNFNDAQFEQISKSKIEMKVFLNIFSVKSLKDINYYQNMWKNFKFLIKCDEKFVENLVKHCVHQNIEPYDLSKKSPCNVFIFMINQLEKFVSHDLIKKMLYNEEEDLILLQSPISQDLTIFSKTYFNLLKIIKKYYESLDLLKILKFINKNNKDFFNYPFTFNSLDALNTAFSEILFAMSSQDENEKYQKIFEKRNFQHDLVKFKNGDKYHISYVDWIISKILIYCYCSSCYEENNFQYCFSMMHKLFPITNIENLFNLCADIIDNCITQKCIHKFELFWVEIEKVFQIENFSHIFEKLIIRCVNGPGFLHFMAFSNNIDIYAKVWSLLLQKWKNLGYIIHEKLDKSNFVNTIIQNGNEDIITLTFKIFKENLNKTQLKNICKLMLDNYLEDYVIDSRFNVNQIVWHFCRDVLKRYEFLNIFFKENKNGENILHYAINNNSEKNILLMLEFLNLAMLPQILKNIFIKKNKKGKNLLQIVYAKSSILSSNVYQAFWQTIRRYFKLSEILMKINFNDFNDEAVKLMLDKEEQELFLEIYENSRNFKSLALKVEMKVNSKTRNKRNNPELMSFDVLLQQNVYKFLCLSPSLNTQKVHKCLQFLLKTSSIKGLENFFKMRNDKSENLFHMCIKNDDDERLKMLCTGIENYLVTPKMPEYYLELISQKDCHSCNIFYCAILYSNNVKIHQFLWELLFKLFQDFQSFKKFILQCCLPCENFIHILLLHCRNLSVIKTLFGMFVSNFNADQHLEFSNFKNLSKADFINTAFRIHLSDTKILKFWWYLIKNSCKTDEEFREIIKCVLISNLRSDEAFEFIINELEQSCSYYEVRDILSSKCKYNRNLLQIAVILKKSENFHIMMWKIFRKYFISPEILIFVNNYDVYNDNLMFNAIAMNTLEIIQLIWDQIESLMSNNEKLNYLKKRGWNNENLIERSFNSISSNYDIYSWIQNLMKIYEI